jgi:cytochrome c oxidase assembly protein subunit 15
MNRALKALSWGTTAVLFLMLLMGALVTNTGSGAGCGASWPLCKGTFMPDWDYAAIIEFGHRAVSGIGGMMTMALAGWTWFGLKRRPLIGRLAVGALVMVIIQGMLGAAAVLWPQPKAVLALHFGISLICFSLVLLVTSLLMQPDRESAPLQAPDPQFRRWVWTVAIFAYAVVYLGAFVRHLKATPACLGWPLCNGQLIPPLYGPVGANFAHRLAAGVLGIMVLRMAVMAYRMAADRADLRRAAVLAALLVLAQVASGAVIATGHINLLTQMVHTALISLFWGALSYLALQVLPVRPEAVRLPKGVATPTAGD